MDINDSINDLQQISPKVASTMTCGYVTDSRASVLRSTTIAPTIEEIPNDEDMVATVGFTAVACSKDLNAATEALAKQKQQLTLTTTITNASLLDEEISLSIQREYGQQYVRNLSCLKQEAATSATTRLANGDVNTSSKATSAASTASAAVPNPVNEFFDDGATASRMNNRMLLEQKYDQFELGRLYGNNGSMNSGHVGGGSLSNDASLQTVPPNMSSLLIKSFFILCLIADQVVLAESTDGELMELEKNLASHHYILKWLVALCFVILVFVIVLFCVVICPARANTVFTKCRIENSVISGFGYSRIGDVNLKMAKCVCTCGTCQCCTSADKSGDPTVPPTESGSSDVDVEALLIT